MKRGTDRASQNGSITKSLSLVTIFSPTVPLLNVTVIIFHSLSLVALPCYFLISIFIQWFSHVPCYHNAIMKLEGRRGVVLVK